MSTDVDYITKTQASRIYSDEWQNDYEQWIGKDLEVVVTKSGYLILHVVKKNCKTR
jgi:hypothetical protein